MFCFSTSPPCPLPSFSEKGFFFINSGCVNEYYSLHNVCAKVESKSLSNRHCVHYLPYCPHPTTHSFLSSSPAVPTLESIPAWRVSRPIRSEEGKLRPMRARLAHSSLLLTRWRPTCWWSLFWGCGDAHLRLDEHVDGDGGLGEHRLQGPWPSLDHKTSLWLEYRPLLIVGRGGSPTGAWTVNTALILKITHLSRVTNWNCLPQTGAVLFFRQILWR